MVLYDVAIIGAGPAGLFASLALAEEARRGRVGVALLERGPRAHHRHCPLLEYGYCRNCKPCMIMEGVGGAGLFSSGIINLRPDIGGDLHKLLGSWSEAQKLIDIIDKVFLYFGAPKNRLFEPDSSKIAELERKALRAGAKFIPAKQRHIGSENTVKIVEAMTSYLEKMGVKIHVLTHVYHIEAKREGYVLKTNKGDLEAKTVIIAPGRSGSHWLSMEAQRLGLETEPGPLDVGVRVETPYRVMEPLTSIIPDPKVVFYTKTYDDKVRTFCTNPKGFVVKEVYRDGLVGVNGESYVSRKSMNTNFAFLVTIKLTNPMEDALEYGRSIARMATKLGGGKPLIQRLGDLISGRRSTRDRIGRSVVEPTLKEATPGDIGMALPHRIITDILEGLEKLDDLAPGVWSKHTLLYAPEVKYYSLKIRVKAPTMETNLPGLYVAGDGAGLSRGINVAAATGYLAAKGVAERLGIEARLPVE
ncbi:NAD(P)/FAD-dependent oxidoreductase [Staphylothermus hellenicus]|uniref:FAD dependent oxidoreductase n=1 Tax=Staphylothermus hellenicus (strain DSM 12710 / JCM 10830 / BK20S6-10-b1 / P8) TaxID=591019 RepID=D7DAI5_STAHD|nr:NAD(P)/FAD-dependent oxidoreductase [Staphylothermus hellenicus]ADI31182.1 FAD dependent oxidoreductase [Staphylothermus hellenicus DSM 12710]